MNLYRTFIPTEADRKEEVGDAFGPGCWPLRAGACFASPPIGSIPIAGERDGRIVGPDPSAEADHFIVCGDCGEAFDCRDLSAVIHHETAGHKPQGRQ